MPIVLNDGFSLLTALPIDTRYVIDTLAERDAMNPLVRYEGLSVYVKEDQIKYILKGGIDNVNWVEDGGSGGGGDLIIGAEELRALGSWFASPRAGAAGAIYAFGKGYFILCTTANATSATLISFSYDGVLWSTGAVQGLPLRNFASKYTDTKGNILLGAGATTITSAAARERNIAISCFAGTLWKTLVTPPILTTQSLTTFIDNGETYLAFPTIPSGTYFYFFTHNINREFKLGTAPLTTALSCLFASYANGEFFIVLRSVVSSVDNYDMYRSADGENWTSVGTILASDYPTNGAFVTAATHDNKHYIFIRVPNNYTDIIEVAEDFTYKKVRRYHTSTNANTPTRWWSFRPFRIAKFGEIYVALSDDPSAVVCSVFASYDLVNWFATGSHILAQSHLQLVAGDQGVIAGSATGAIQASGKKAPIKPFVLINDESWLNNVEVVGNSAGKLAASDDTLLFMKGGSTDIIDRKPALGSWTTATLPSARVWNRLYHLDGVFIVYSNATTGDRLAYSTDEGATWTPVTILLNSWQAAGIGNGDIVIPCVNVGSATPHRILTSPDGINWSIETVPTTAGGFSAAAYGDGVWVLFGNGEYYAYSDDNRATWNVVNFSTGGVGAFAVQDCVYFNGAFWGYSQSGLVGIEPDSTEYRNPVQLQEGTSGSLRIIDGKLVSLTQFSNSYLVSYSEDGEEWRNISTLYSWFDALRFDGEDYLLVGTPTSTLYKTPSLFDLRCIEDDL
jgi:hypothetical protein